MDSGTVVVVILAAIGVAGFLGYKIGYKKGVKDTIATPPTRAPKAGEAGGGGC